MSDKIRFEVYGDVDDMDWDPSQWADCESEDELKQRILEVAEDNSTWGIRIVGASISTLWHDVERNRWRFKKEANP